MPEQYSHESERAMCVPVGGLLLGRNRWGYLLPRYGAGDTPWGRVLLDDGPEAPRNGLRAD